MFSLLAGRGNVVIKDSRGDRRSSKKHHSDSHRSSERSSHHYARVDSRYDDRGTEQLSPLPDRDYFKRREDYPARADSRYHDRRMEQLPSLPDRDYFNRREDYPARVDSRYDDRRTEQLSPLADKDYFKRKEHRNSVMHQPEDVRRQQQAYSSRASNVGYGSRTSSSLQRTYPISASIQNVLYNIEASDPNIELVQPIDQMSIPGISQYGSGGGMCAGVLREWMTHHARHPSAEASRRLGRALNDDLPSIGHAQGVIGQQRTRWSAFSSVEESSEKNASLIYESGGLPLIKESQGFFFTNSPEGYASELLKHMEQDGFYSISLHSPAGGVGGHVIGAQVSRATGEYKLVDANTGEFRTYGRESFRRLIEANARYMTYDKQLNGRYSICHYSPSFW